jgi:hypothetical protein
LVLYIYRVYILSGLLYNSFKNKKLTFSSHTHGILLRNIGCETCVENCLVSSSYYISIASILILKALFYIVRRVVSFIC